MAEIADFLAKMETKDWIALYAAILSTATASVQIANARRDRPRLKVKLTYVKNRPPASTEWKHVTVRLANTGNRPIPIYRPQLELARVHEHPAIYFASPNAEYDDYHHEWVELRNDGHEEPFDFAETNVLVYQFTMRSSTSVLSLRVLDRADVVRYRRRTLLGPLYRLMFRARNGWRQFRQRGRAKSRKVEA